MPTDGTRIDLSFTGATDAGLKELQQALPRCEISHDRGS